MTSEGLQFWIDHDVVPQGVAWLFPCGDRSRAGVASYTGRRDLSDDFARFMERIGAKPGQLHGNFFPSRLGQATAGSVFRVGDAAGQCMGLTGEGIRPAIAFGSLCGRLVQGVIDGKVSRDEALALYSSAVDKHRIRFAGLRMAQVCVAGAPSRVQGWLAAALARTPMGRLLLGAYAQLGLDVRQAGNRSTEAAGIGTLPVTAGRVRTYGLLRRQK